MSDKSERLVVNTLVRVGGRVWLVTFVNDSRATLYPISGQAAIRIGSGKPFTTFGSTLDVSPNSLVETVDPDTLDDLERIRYNRQKEEVMATVAAPPGVEAGAQKQTLKQKNEERKARLAAAKAAAPPKEPRVKKEKVQNACKCGCGELTGGFFYPGHDARFKGWLLQVERGQKKVEELPEAVRTGYKWKKTADGKGYYPLTNYKGEAYVPQA